MLEAIQVTYNMLEVEDYVEFAVENVDEGGASGSALFDLLNFVPQSCLV